MKKLKKIVALTMLVAAPLTFTGCNNDKDDDYKLNFMSDSEKVHYTIVSSGNEKIDLPEEPSKKGYNFGGWYMDENYTVPFTSESLVNKDLEGDLKIYAKWDVINYDITYHLDEGVNSNVNPSSYNINSNINLENPTKENHTFLGWYLDEDYTTKVTTINSDFKGQLNLYAKWSIYDYEIVYHLDGAIVVNANPSGYDENNNEIVLQNIDRAGYDFLGWYSDSSYKTQINSIAANSSGQIEVYAKWGTIFEYSNGEITGIAEYGKSKNITDLVIPEKIDNMTIDTIGVHAFYNNNLDSVTIPKSVTSIEGGAFNSTKEINIMYQGSLEEWLSINMGSNIFNNDNLYIGGTKLNDIIIPTNVTSIGSNAFYGINANKFVVHGNVSSIGKNSFAGSNAANIYYEDTLAKWLSIDKGQTVAGKKYDLYIGGTKLNNLVIPESVKTLKDNALSGINVESITIHDEITTLGKYALDIDAEIRINYSGTIDQWLNIEKKENSIYNAKLYINDNLVTSVEISENLTIIKENALIGIKGIVDVKVHDKVYLIESGALNTGMSINIHYLGTISEWTKIDVEATSINKGSYLYVGNDLVEDLVIADETTSIKENTFAFFAFESVTIHDEVTEIGENAFMKDGEITIYCEADSKPSGWDENWQIGNTVYFGNEW